MSASASDTVAGPEEIDIACRQLVELITDYLDAELAAPAQAAFERHLDDCPPCAVYLDQMRQTIAELGRLPVDSLSAGAKRDLVATFRELRILPY